MGSHYYFSSLELPENYSDKNIIAFEKYLYIISGERSSGSIPAIPQTTVINVLNFKDVYSKKVDQQVISVQDRSHYLYWTEKVHNVIVLSGFLELGTGIL